MYIYVYMHVCMHGWRALHGLVSYGYCAVKLLEGCRCCTWILGT